ncbi:hypothetical protein IGI96_000888 [Enterococcus sp. DIV0421]
MNYRFLQLYQRAIESDNVNDFVKQAGLNLIDVDNVELLLTHIYNLAKNE